MSCWSCLHSNPTGCIKQRPEFETLTPCDQYCYEPGTLDEITRKDEQ